MAQQDTKQQDMRSQTPNTLEVQTETLEELEARETQLREACQQLPTADQETEARLRASLLRKQARKGQAAYLKRLLHMTNFYQKTGQHLSPISSKEDQSLDHPESLQVQLEEGKGGCSWGGQQAWFSRSWQRSRGCSVTAASLITAYMARKAGQVSLFRPYRHALRSRGFVDARHVYSKAEFLEHMEDLWTYLHPGLLGIYRPRQMKQALEQFCRDRGHSFHALSYRLKPRLFKRTAKTYEEMLDFIQSQLLFDAPLAMLIYDRGKLRTVQSWHWVSVIGIHFNKGQQARLTLIDHGNWLELDLDQWFQTTRLGGAFVSCQPRHLGLNRDWDDNEAD